MASSALTPILSQAPASRGPRASRLQPGGRASAPLALAGVLLLGALLLAPEQPRHQEAICHRHNGVEACRVW